MAMLNILEAKTHLSRLIDAVESGSEKEIIIARNGRPAAKLVPIDFGKRTVRLGLAKGEFVPPASLDDDPQIEAEVHALFHGTVD